MKREREILKNWKFAAGESEDCLAEGKAVTIPHTWNVEGYKDLAGIRRGIS